MQATARGLTIVTGEGVTATVEADTIIPAVPLSPDTRLPGAVKDMVAEVHAIGDCRDASRIVDAIGSGLQASLSV